MKPLYILCGALTGMISYTMYSNLLTAIVCAFFWIFAWIYWVISQTINLSIIKQTFSFFFV